MDNLICAKCNEKIEEADLVECPHCWEIYHRECWEKTATCLNCKKFNLDFVREITDEEDEKEEEEKQFETVDEEPETADSFDDFSIGKEPRNSNIAHTIMSISNIVLIMGIIVGVLIAVYGFFVTRSLISGIIGVVAGGATAAMGWVASILVSGFAELINNSQKNAHYLSKLVEKQEEKED